MNNQNLNTPEGLLVRIKMKLCMALNINAPTLRMLVDRFVNIHYDRTSSKTHFTKVNFYNELSADKMTIKAFINKFLRIIQIKKMVITITVTTIRDKEVTVTEEIYLGDQSPPQEEKQDD